MIDPLLEFLGQVRPIHALLLVIGPYLLFSLSQYVDARKLPSVQLLISSVFYAIFLLWGWFLYYAFRNTVEVSHFEPFDLSGSIFLGTVFGMGAILLLKVMDKPKDFHSVWVVLSVAMAAMLAVLLPALIWVIVRI